MPRQPFNIAWVTHSLARGGSPIFLLEFLKRLDRSEFQGILVAEKDGPLREAFEQAGFPVQVIPRRGLLEAGLTLDLRRCLAKHAVQLVHLNTFSSYYKYAALAARLAGLPVIWGIREDVRARRCQKLLPWIKRLSTVIMPCSHEIARHLYRGPLPPKVQVVHDGLPLPSDRPSAPDLRAQLGIAPGTPLVGYVASLEPRKGAMELVEAMALLREEGSRAQAVIIGEDRSAGRQYEPALRRKIAALRLDRAVHLTGGRADAASLYPQFDVFALPTQWEGISRVLLEAAEALCPIVTTDAGGNGEFIQTDRSGLLVPPGDPKALAEALQKMLCDRPFAKRCARCARETLETRFDLKTHTDAVAALYRRWILNTP